MLRKSLLYIRKNYNNKDSRIKFLSIWGAIFLAGVIGGIALDVFVPFGAGWNVMRMLPAIPTAISGFVLAYSLSLFLHYRNMKINPMWQPYRARSSLMMRRRIALLIGAVGIVIIYAQGTTPGYTFVTSMVVLLCIALFAYIRPTKSEARKELLDIPDARDIRFERLKEQVAEEQRQEEYEKARRKAEEKQQRSRFHRKDDTEE